jgi:hypothetical protein
MEFVERVPGAFGGQVEMARSDASRHPFGICLWNGPIPSHPHSMKSELMKPLSLCCVVFFVMFSLAPMAARAEDDFRIKGLREIRATDLILVNDSWVRDPNRIMATVRVKEDAPASGITLKAYFYDKDNQVIASGKPNPIWAQTPRGFQSVGVPETLQKGKDISVYFCVTQEIDAKKWKTVLVVFGNSTSVVARSFPADAYPKLTFPEQDHVVKEKPGL